MKNTLIDLVDQPRLDLPFRWSGGVLCLDFVNTVAWNGESARPELERLTGYGRLAEWAREAAILDRREAEALCAEAERLPIQARRTLEQAHALRTTMHRIFSAHDRQTVPDPGALAAFNVALSDTMARIKIEPDGSGFVPAWAGAEESLDTPLWSVVRSAADLLTSSRLSRVHICLGDGCGFLFLDTSRPGNRRWCNMAQCGNRAKARRHYARIRGA